MPQIVRISSKRGSQTIPRIGQFLRTPMKRSSTVRLGNAPRRSGKAFASAMPWTARSAYSPALSPAPIAVQTCTSASISGTMKFDISTALTTRAIAVGLVKASTTSGLTSWNKLSLKRSTVRKYTRVKKLTQTMVNELIDHIEVNQAEKVDGVWEQRLTIHYSVVGPITIPEDLPLPVPGISMNTRQVVWLNYAATQKSDARHRLDTVTNITLVTRTGFEPMLKA